MASRPSCVCTSQPDQPVKYARLRVINRSGRSRQLSITGYWEWVLGELRAKSMMHVVTEMDPVTGALFARNPYSYEFSDRVAFVDCSEATRTWTGDRTEFLGRNGSAANPAAMRRVRLSNRTGAGFDPCAAMQTSLLLNDGQERIVVFTIGAGRGDEEVRNLVQRSRGEANAQRGPGRSLALLEPDSGGSLRRNARCGGELSR